MSVDNRRIEVRGMLRYVRLCTDYTGVSAVVWVPVCVCACMYSILYSRNSRAFVTDLCASLLLYAFDLLLIHMCFNTFINSNQTLLEYV